LVSERTDRTEEAHRAPWLVRLEQNLGEGKESIGEAVGFTQTMSHAQPFLRELSTLAEITASGDDLAEV
jgi:hypothetical protein